MPQKSEFVCRKVESYTILSVKVPLLQGILTRHTTPHSMAYFGRILFANLWGVGVVKIVFMDILQVGKREVGPPKTGSGSLLLLLLHRSLFGFCRKVLWKGSHSKKPVEEPSHRTSNVLQTSGSQEQFFRPCKVFSHQGQD